MANHYPQQPNLVNPVYSNTVASPTPSARMNQAMLSPAAANTAPIFGPSVQIASQQQQGPQQPGYNCAMNSPLHSPMQQPANVGPMPVQVHANAMPMNMNPCHIGQPTYQQQHQHQQHQQQHQHQQQQQHHHQQHQGYPQTAGTNMQGASMVNVQMGYNGFNSTAPMMNTGNGYVPVNPCNGNGYLNTACNQQNGAVVVAGAACSNNQGQQGNNWSCQGYANVVPNQNATTPFQPSIGWNNQAAPAVTVGQPMNNASNSQAAVQQQQQQYSNMQPMNGTNGMNYNYSRPPLYGQVATAIQCQDVSQSQDASRVRTQEVAQVQAQPQVVSQVQATPTIGTAAAANAQSSATPANMRPETYQRTLEYVQQCQTWTTGDSVKAAKENKPPQGTVTEAAGNAVKSAETTARPALLSPGQDAVSSSTDRPDAANADQAVAANTSNMVVHDMNTSLNSLMQETRFLQMIQ